MPRSSTRWHGWLSSMGARGLGLSSLSLLLCVLTLGIIWLAGARQAAWEEAEFTWSNRATALERDIARQINLIDLSLQAIAATMEMPLVGETAPIPRPLALFDQSATAGSFRVVMVLNAKGSLVASSDPHLARQMNFADQDHFLIHRQQQNAGPYVSEPYRGRSPDDAPRLAISRRLASPDGVFRGTVVATFRIAFVNSIFDQIHFGARGSATLMRSDGHPILHRPAEISGLAANLDGGDLLHRIHSTPSGQFVAKPLMDKADYLYTFRPVGKLPLLLVLSTPVEDVYSAWWRKVWASGLSFVGLCVFIGLLLSYFWHRKHRFGAGAVVIGTTAPSVCQKADDPTGLANRSYLDMRLKEVWQHAILSGAPLSLVLVEVDFINAFNERYGRLSGDDLLARIGTCAQSVILQHSDLAARFSGYQLALLLPDTEENGAATLAEMLRASVDGLGIKHAGSPKEHVTVSIGWASCYPRSPQQPDNLLAATVHALAVAKVEGRNRVEGMLVQIHKALPA
jgi:diguanylate cyclase (GGDEF)-like protein